MVGFYSCCAKAGFDELLRLHQGSISMIMRCIYRQLLVSVCSYSGRILRMRYDINNIVLQLFLTGDDQSEQVKDSFESVTKVSLELGLYFQFKLSYRSREMLNGFRLHQASRLVCQESFADYGIVPAFSSERTRCSGRMTRRRAQN